MKRFIKRILVKLLKPIILKLGFKESNHSNIEKSKNSKNGLLINFYEILKEVNFNPKSIVDIGANRGTWTKLALKYFPDASYSLFEPQYWMEEFIKPILDKNKKVKFYPYGVGKKRGTFKFTIHSRNDSCSFRYSELEAKKAGFEQLDLPIITLNEFFKENKLQTPDIVKIDAEGLDLEVLEGSSDFFGQTEIFLVEAGVVNNNVNNSIQKVMKFMKSKGYKLFDITDLNRPFEMKVLWLVELVFVKEGGMLDRKKTFNL